MGSLVEYVSAGHGMILIIGAIFEPTSVGIGGRGCVGYTSEPIRCHMWFEMDFFVGCGSR